MYNGIGLQTPRGSGTNGHVQRNVAFMRARPERIQYNTETTIARKIQSMDRMPNSDILDHERKRQIEVKVAELTEAMRDQKFEEGEITERAKALRATLTAKANRAMQSESGAASSDGPSAANLQLKEHGRLTGRNTHEITAATNERNRKLREAFGIGEYAPPPVKSKEQLEEERLTKYTKQYAIVPNSEVVDDSSKEHREKQEELLKLREMEVLYKSHEKQTRATQESITTGSVTVSKGPGGSTIASSNTTAENAQLKKALKKLLKNEGKQLKKQVPEMDGEEKSETRRDMRRDPSVSSSTSSRGSQSYRNKRKTSTGRAAPGRRQTRTEQSPGRRNFDTNLTQSSGYAASRSTHNFKRPNQLENSSKRQYSPDASANDRLEKNSSYKHSDYEPDRNSGRRQLSENRENAGNGRSVKVDTSRRPYPVVAKSISRRRSRSRSREADQNRGVGGKNLPPYDKRRRMERSRSSSRSRTREEKPRVAADENVKRSHRSSPKGHSRSRSPAVRQRRRSSRRRRSNSSRRSNRQRSPVPSNRSRIRSLSRRPASRSLSKSPVSRHDLQRKPIPKPDRNMRRRSSSRSSSERHPTVKSVAHRRSPTTSRSRSRTPTKPSTARIGRRRASPSQKRRSPPKRSRTPPKNKVGKNGDKSRHSRSRSRSGSRKRSVSRSSSSPSPVHRRPQSEKRRN